VSKNFSTQGPLWTKSSFQSISAFIFYLYKHRGISCPLLYNQTPPHKPGDSDSRNTNNPDDPYVSHKDLMVCCKGLNMSVRNHRDPSSPPRSRSREKANLEKEGTVSAIPRAGYCSSGTAVPLGGNLSGPDLDLTWRWGSWCATWNVEPQLRKEGKFEKLGSNLFCT
jgi:hypothetical protein